MRKTPMKLVSLGCICTVLFGCSGNGDEIEQAMHVEESQESLPVSSSTVQELPSEFLFLPGTENDSFCTALRELNYSEVSYTFDDQGLLSLGKTPNQCDFISKNEVDGELSTMVALISNNMSEDIGTDVVPFGHDDETGVSTFQTTDFSDSACFATVENVIGTLLVGVANFEQTIEQKCADAAEMAFFIHKNLLAGEKIK